MDPNLQALSDRIDQMATQLGSVQTVLNYHQHLGYDKSSTLDGNTISNFITIPSLPYYQTFGDASDGNASASSGTTTLTRDVFYNNLTLSGTAKIVTSGWRIFVNGTLTISGTASIQYNGNNGAAPPSPNNFLIGGIGASALSGGSVPGGLAGSDGGITQPVQSNANGLPGGSGVAGLDASPSIGGIGAQGGQGGAGGQAAGKPGGAHTAGGLGGNVTAAKNLPRTIISAYENFDQMPTFTLHKGSSGAGGGSGGGAGANAGVASNGAGGGGGGSGGTGGIVVVYARNIINSATGGIQAIGGNGGAGGAAIIGGASGGSSSGGSGGGGGGAGGTGGVLIIVYNTLTQTGTFSVDGGTGGAGGAFSTGAGVSFQQGDPGIAGSTGGTGLIWMINILS